MSAETVDDADDTEVGPISALRPPRRPDHIKPVDWDRMSYWQRKQAARRVLPVPAHVVPEPSEPSDVAMWEDRPLQELRTAMTSVRRARKQRTPVTPEVRAMAAAYDRWVRGTHKDSSRKTVPFGEEAERLALLAAEGHTLTSAALVLGRPRKTLDRQLRRSPERLEILRWLQRNQAAR